MRESPGSLRPGYVDPPNILEVIGPTPTTLLIISAGLLANCWLLLGIYSLTSGGAGGVRGLRELPLEAFSLLKTFIFSTLKPCSPYAPVWTPKQTQLSPTLGVWLQSQRGSRRNCSESCPSNFLPSSTPEAGRPVLLKGPASPSSELTRTAPPGSQGCSPPRGGRWGVVHRRQRQRLHS